MNIISKKNLIANVSKRWDEQYRNTGSKDKILKGERLRTEKPTTEEQIKKIIGNDSWTRNHCHECGNDSEITIQLGQEPDYESATANICPVCLKKALEIIFCID